MPPPSSGGVTLAMIRAHPRGLRSRQGAFHSPRRSCTSIFEAMRRAFVARNAKLGDPDFVHEPGRPAALARVGGGAARDHQARPRHADAGARAARPGPIRGRRTRRTSRWSTPGATRSPLTTTLNWFFGSGVTVPGAGFMLNNEMDDFATVPGTPNGFGLVQGEPNAVAPGKRMLSSMSPSIVVGKDGHVPRGPRRGGRAHHHHRGLRDPLERRRLRARSHDRRERAALPRARLPRRGHLREGRAPGAAQERARSDGLHVQGARAHRRRAGDWLGRHAWVGAAEPRRIGGLARAGRIPRATHGETAGQRGRDARDRRRAARRRRPVRPHAPPEDLRRLRRPDQAQGEPPRLRAGGRRSAASRSITSSSVGPARPRQDHARAHPGARDGRAARHDERPRHRAQGRPGGAAHDQARSGTTSSSSTRSTG